MQDTCKAKNSTGLQHLGLTRNLPKPHRKLHWRDHIVVLEALNAASRNLHHLPPTRPHHPSQGANSQELMVGPCALKSEKPQAHASTNNAGLQQHRATRTSLRAEGQHKTLPLTVYQGQCARHSSMDSARFLTTSSDATSARLEDNATSQPRRSKDGRRRGGSSLQHNACGSLCNVFLPLCPCGFRPRSNP